MRGQRERTTNYEQEGGDGLKVELAAKENKLYNESTYMQLPSDHPTTSTTHWEERLFFYLQEHICVSVHACFVFSMKAFFPTNFTADLREAMRLLISSTEGSSPSVKSDLLLKLLPPETPWKQGVLKAKAMKYDVIH